MALKKKKSEDLSGWYLWVVEEAQLADYAPVKGCMIIRPNGFALWERVQTIFDRAIKKMGVKNAYFPLFIPESFLHREKEHVEGFSPELAIVTIGGGEKLEEPLVVRPTSETIMYAAYSKWVRSHRDLPLLINQWCNVVRWEKRTFPFLRTLEFLWQEGHTAHATLQEADDMTMGALAAYQEFIEQTLAIPVIIGKKSNGQKFAGALYTTTCEALMPDGKALQAATSHNLGQNFAKKEAFNISFQGPDKSTQYAWQTSWGLSTRILGALIMTHGDDKGLIIPPKFAPQLIEIIPIFKTDADEDRITAECERLANDLRQHFTVEVNTSENTPGYKFHDCEIRGIPFRIEMGPKEVDAKTAVLVRRDTGEKETLAEGDLTARIRELSDVMQTALFQRAKKHLEEHTFEATTLDECASLLDRKRGFVVAPWCGDADCEDRVKAKTKATARAIPFEQPISIGHCFVCDKEGKHSVYWARAY